MQLFIQNFERRGDGTKHRVVRQWANEERKRTYQIQSYVIFLHFRLTLSVLNCDIPSLRGRGYYPSSVQRFNHTFRQEVCLTARAQIMHGSGSDKCSNFGCTYPQQGTSNKIMRTNAVQIPRAKVECRSNWSRVQPYIITQKKRIEYNPLQVQHVANLALWISIPVVIAVCY